MFDGDLVSGYIEFIFIFYLIFEWKSTHWTGATMKNLARDYILLAFAINAHSPGYIDAYFGPVEVKEEAEAQEKLPLETLAIEADRLIAALPGAGFETQRTEFLAAQLTAMQATIRQLRGEQLPLREEARLVYGLEPDWVSESRFSEAHRQLHDLLPPGDSLRERMLAQRKAAEVSVEIAMPIMEEVRQKLRVRTRQLFSLPVDEDFELVTVKGQPWSAYNWYLGKARSRIEINTDLPLRASTFLGLISHEGYPGHHTELSIKETRLVNEHGWQEHGIALINAPSCSISEGLANCALDTVLSAEEQVQWEADVYARAGVKLDAARAVQIRRTAHILGYVNDNAAFMLHDQGIPPAEVAGYIQRWALVSPEQAQKSTSFVSAYRAYVFNYSWGMDLLEKLFAEKGHRQTWFTRLLTEPVTTGMIKRWIERN
jgi:hypothetical protein